MRRERGITTKFAFGCAYFFWRLSNALVQLQAQYHHCGEAASEKCLSAATFVSRWATPTILEAQPGMRQFDCQREAFAKCFFRAIECSQNDRLKVILQRDERITTMAGDVLQSIPMNQLLL